MGGRGDRPPLIRVFLSVLNVSNVLLAVRRGCLATYHGARMTFVMLLRIKAAIRTTGRGVYEPQRLGGGCRTGRPHERAG